MSTGRKLACGLVAAALLLAGGERLARVARDSLASPWELGLETPNVTTIALLREGRNVYDPAVYAELPFALTMYTPLYHLVVAALPATPGNPYRTGRWVSLFGLLGASCALLAAGRRRLGVWAALAAMGVFWLFWPVTQRAAFVRGDLLGLAFAAWAVVMLCGRDGRRRPVTAALLCVLALATKQTFVAAPAACGLALLLEDRRRALRFVLTFAALAGGLALWATLAWGPGFWFSTLVVPRNPLNVLEALGYLATLPRQPLVWALLALAGALAWFRPGREGALRDSAGPPRVFALYLSCATLVMLVTIWKWGSGTNYFLEPCLALLLWLVARTRPRPDVGLAGRPPAWMVPAGLGVLSLAAVLELSLTRTADYTYVDAAQLERKAQWVGKLQEHVASLGFDDPTVLCLHRTSLNYLLQDRAYVSDQLLYRFAWDAGRLSVEPLLDALRTGVFDVVVVPTGAMEAEQGPSFAAIHAGIREHYRVARTEWAYEYWVHR